MKGRMKDWYDEIFSVICLHSQALDYIKIDINRANVFVETYVVRTYVTLVERYFASQRTYGNLKRFLLQYRVRPRICL